MTCFLSHRAITCQKITQAIILDQVPTRNGLDMAIVERFSPGRLNYTELRAKSGGRGRTRDISRIVGEARGRHGKNGVSPRALPLARISFGSSADWQAGRAGMGGPQGSFHNLPRRALISHCWFGT